MASHAVGLQCFIAMEMVIWLQDNVDDIEFRKQAVRFAQVSIHYIFISLQHEELCNSSQKMTLVS